MLEALRNMQPILGESMSIGCFCIFLSAFILLACVYACLCASIFALGYCVLLYVCMCVYLDSIVVTVSSI